MRQRENENIAWPVSHVHDEEQAFAPVGMEVHGIGERFGDLMCESFVESGESCHKYSPNEIVRWCLSRAFVGHDGLPLLQTLRHRVRFVSPTSRQQLP